MNKTKLRKEVQMKKLLVAALIAGAAFATYAAPAAKTAPKADAKKVECTCQKDAKACAKRLQSLRRQKRCKSLPCKTGCLRKGCQKGLQEISLAKTLVMKNPGFSPGIFLYRSRKRIPEENVMKAK
jgi:hypothetical protein